MQATHIIWILIGIIVILLIFDINKAHTIDIKENKSSYNAPIPAPMPVASSLHMTVPIEQEQQPQQQYYPPILKSEEKPWVNEVKEKKAVRFTFSNDIKDIDKDQKGTQELDAMYIEARTDVPTDDPYACKQQSTSLPFANINPHCMLPKGI